MLARCMLWLSLVLGLPCSWPLPAAAGKVAKSQVAASQIDWRVLQQSQTERWLKCVRRAFMGKLSSQRLGLGGALLVCVMPGCLQLQKRHSRPLHVALRRRVHASSGHAVYPLLPPRHPLLPDLDTDGDGIISSDDMVAMLRNKLPKAEVSVTLLGVPHPRAQGTTWPSHC